MKRPEKPLPKDPNQRAAEIVRLSTEEPPVSTVGKNRATKPA
jgi:hypothetical protein